MSFFGYDSYGTTLTASSAQDEAFITIPGLAGGAVGTKYDWNISYAPSKYLGGRAPTIPQGKVVGGSTKLNRMVSSIPI